MAFFGIDLGTTYSCIAGLNGGKPETIKNLEGKTTTPSVIDLKDDGTYTVGDIAKDDILSDGTLVEEIKREMGNMDYELEVGGKKFNPVILSSLILKKLKDDTEKQGYTIDGVTITCPAYFGTTEKHNTKVAGELAGLKVLSVINEPTAAAYSYVMEKLQVGDKKTVMVYDLGGGTFDVTLLEVEVVDQGENEPLRKIRVITSQGDHKLGGKDWDARLMSKIVEKACADLGCSEEDITDDIETYKDITRKTEKAKMMLSDKDSHKINIVSLNGNCKVEVTIDEFESITADLLETTISLTEKALDELVNESKRLDQIILVGGSTRMRQVEKAIRGNAKIASLMDSIEIIMHDPDEAVAKGAAVWANVMGEAETEANTDDPKEDPKKPVKPGGDTELPPKKPSTSISVIEKLNKSYGIVILGDDRKTELVSNIIFKDTDYDPTVGVTMVDSYATVVPNQSSIKFRIMENDVKDKETDLASATELYNFRFELPQGTPEGTGIEVKFFFDSSSILHISVEEAFKHTRCDGEQVQLLGAISQDQIIDATAIVKGLNRQDD